MSSTTPNAGYEFGPFAPNFQPYDRPWPTPSGFPPPQPAPAGYQVPGGFAPPVGPPVSPPKHLKKVLWGLIGVAVIAVIALVIPMLVPPAYQNGDYQVPEINRSPPAYQPTLEPPEVLQRNPLYGQQVPNPIKCDLDRSGKAVDLDEAQLEKIVNDTTACAMIVWNQPVTKAGFELYRAGVEIYDEKAYGTACGDLRINASFCGPNQQFYWSMQMIRSLTRRDPDLADVDPLFQIEVQGHEFGHALQYRVGIVQSVRQLQALEADGNLKWMQWSRRQELQADCFSGMFLRAIARSVGISNGDFEDAQRMARVVGDRTPGLTHGLPLTRQKWLTRGWDNSDISVCNTFTAPEADVR